MKFIIGRKIEMTQIVDEKRNVIPVTKIEVLPCYVIAKKTREKDEYSAIQIACDEIKKANQPMSKFFEKIFGGPKYFRHIQEFRMEQSDPMFSKLEVGQKLDANVFAKGDVVSVSGTSKGRGFQGVVKRYGFAGAPKTHGNKDQLRMHGSIGATHPNHVFKGIRMAGHMGDVKVTVKGLEIMDVLPEQNFLYVKGGVPGARHSMLTLRGKGEFEISNIQFPISNEMPNDNNKTLGIQ
ncbi:50S ribosomal protein L3 [Candidatus Falkowbacteria bacterium]|nr:50S ribosomal protein L3 [Candidatus Falkowbacteria bacterium]